MQQAFTGAVEKSMKDLIQKLSNYAEQLECEAELDLAHDIDKVCYLLDQSVDVRQVSVASVLRCHTEAMRQQMVQTSGNNRELFRDNLKKEAEHNTAFLIKSLEEIYSKTHDEANDNKIVSQCAFVKTLAQLVVSWKR